MRKAVRRLPNEQLRRERQRRGWSREYVAEQIGVADPKTIGRWERGIASPSSHFLQKLCGLFGMLAEDLGLYHEASHANNTSPITPYVVSSPLPISSASQSSSEHKIFTVFASPQHETTISPSLGGFPAGSIYEPYRFKQHLYAEKRLIQSVYSLQTEMYKTNLVVEFAQDPTLQQRFCNGVLWVSLGQQPNVLSLLAQWGTLLGFMDNEMGQMMCKETWARAIRAAIGLQRMLLVIDNAWDYEEALAFKVGGANCGYLLTTHIPSIALYFANECAFTPGINPCLLTDDTFLIKYQL